MIIDLTSNSYLKVHVSINRDEVTFVLHAPLQLHHHWFASQSIQEWFRVNGKGLQFKRLLLLSEKFTNRRCCQDSIISDHLSIGWVSQSFKVRQGQGAQMSRFSARIGPSHWILTWA